MLMIILNTLNQAAKHLEKLAPQLINQTMNRAQAAAPRA